VPQSNVLGTVQLVLPHAGTAVLLIASPWGRLTLLGVPLTVVMVEEALLVLRWWRRRRPSGAAAEQATGEQLAAV